MDGVVNLISQKVGDNTRVAKKDVAKQVSDSLERACKELGKVYKYTDGKANVEFLLSLVGSYLIIKLDGEEPDRTPEDMLRDDILPFIATMDLEVTHKEEGYDVGELTKQPEEEVS